jgi:glutamate racemase
MRPLPIGVFDSGVGGLTVLRALQAALPHESFLYLGDTARLPYGTKSADTISRYAHQATRALVERGIKLLVVACNTASAVACDDLRAHFPGIPVLGVVEPGARAAVRASKRGRIAVIGTEGTIKGGAYTRAIAREDGAAVVVGRACPLFVALAEEGWTDGPIPTAIAHAYLDDLVDDVDTLVLGCTHFPLLSSVIAAVAGSRVAIVDSADTTAAAALELLDRADLRASEVDTTPTRTRVPVRLLATDGPERFARVGSRFLGLTLHADAVEIVDL